MVAEMINSLAVAACSNAARNLACGNAPVGFGSHYADNEPETEPDPGKTTSG